jgi:hypothetical protein
MRKPTGLAATLVFATLLYAADFSVSVSNLVTGPVSHVELANTGAQPVTAWSLAITTPSENGGTRRVIETMDAYLADVTRDLPRSSPHLDWLRPGQTREIPLDPLPHDATVQIVAVVLEDVTSAGDPQIIKSIFERRAGERDELRRVVDTFNDVLQSKHGVAALQELKDRFAMATGPQESTPHRTAREAVETYLQRATVGNREAAEQSIRAYAALVARQYELAVKHSR